MCITNKYILREDLNSDLSDQINEADEIVEFLQQNADKISPRKIANTVAKTNQVVHSITEDNYSLSEKQEKYVKFSDKSNLMWDHIKCHDY